MRDQALFDKIDLHLIGVLHTVLIERSVSHAAMRLVDPTSAILLDPRCLPRLVALLKTRCHFRRSGIAISGTHARTQESAPAPWLR